MGNAKIEVTLGGITFSGEGEEDWLSQQLDKILKTAPELVAAAPPAGNAATPLVPPSGTPGPLATFIKAKGGDNSQVKRFLATAAWLRRRGQTNLTTAAVSKALADNQQKRLGNPADCLNQNVSKGHCEKTPNGGFYITPDGLREVDELS
jgi:hypothetical protein